jgi:type IX secretion system substrate protein
MKKSAILLFLLILLVISDTQLYSQMTAQGKPSSAAQEMVDYLIGNAEGITVSNPKLISYTSSNKKNHSAGFFKDNGAGIGINEGIILTSGHVSNINKLTGFYRFEAKGLNGEPGDPDLSKIVDSKTKDATILEFDFISKYSNIEFKYVFASEEYDEYACDKFNDVFAFLFSGPGVVSNIQGLTGVRNVALVPMTDLPVSIRTVSRGFRYPGTNDDMNREDCSTNEEFYNSNLKKSKIAYDGYTDVFTAKLENLQIGETYHIKLAIADVIDEDYDSAVLLEAGSFKIIKDTINIYAAEVFAKPGDIIEVPIYLEEEYNFNSDNLTGYTTELSFDASLLEPVNATPMGTVSNGIRTIELNLNAQPDGDMKLGSFEFRALNSTTTSTNLGLNNTSSQGMNIYIVVIETDGIFQLISTDALTLKAGNVKGSPRDIVTIPIYLYFEENQLLGVDSITTELCFNKTLLLPEESAQKGIIDNDIRAIPIKLNLTPDAEDISNKINCKVFLGNAEGCPLTFRNTKIHGNQVALNEIPGKLDVTGLCYEGGVRLINPEGELKFTNLSPNPADEYALIELSLLETGSNEILVFDFYGRELTSMKFSNGTRGRTKKYLDTSNLPDGKYLLILKTPSQVRNQILTVIH